MNRRVFACGHAHEPRGTPFPTSDGAVDSHEDDTGAWSASEKQVLETCTSLGVSAVSSSSAAAASSSSAAPYFPASSAASQPEVFVVPGPLLQALPQLDAQRVALLHVDTGSFESTLQARILKSAL